MYHFPLVDPNNRLNGKRMPIEHYIGKVREELAEFVEATSQKSDKEQAREVVDVLHAAETLVRKFFEGHPYISFEDIVKETRIKNDARGYYK